MYASTAATGGSRASSVFPSSVGVGSILQFLFKNVDFYSGGHHRASGPTLSTPAVFPLLNELQIDVTLTSKKTGGFVQWGD